ncbi:MAG TPA: hypothetical protein VKZ41_02965 [Gemmatimonadales bacterium]|nr:hypothetical protein [Gemmatimonadales bacterium]
MSKRLSALIVAVFALVMAGSYAAFTAGGTLPGITFSGQTATLPERLTDREFARLGTELSEPGGFFDSDNLVSNEASYLHILGLVRQVAPGGVYIGVGPDQSFSYIAASRPHMAFILDIRRDNMLLHLLYKAAFEEARNRLEFLALFFGRPVPSNLAAWDALSLGEIIAWLDENPPTDASREEAEQRLFQRITNLPLDLDEMDLSTLRRFHDSYVNAGLDIRFQSMGRPPRPYYPTYRQMLLEQDANGLPGSYLVSEQAFETVQLMQRRNLVVPVVGDLAGEAAMVNIGRWLRQRDATVSVFYASNVEYYLARDGRLQDFGRNLSELPRDSSSLVVRSLFRGTYGVAGTRALPGYLSAQVAAPMDSVVRALTSEDYIGYADLISRGLIR